jgi:hypothetical protein
MLRPTIVDCSAVAHGFSFCERATREKGARTDDRVKRLKRTVRTKYLALVILIIASLFMFSDRFYHPKYTTESENARFNQWVDYYSGCEGYTVEYYSFNAFKIESDTVTLRQSNRLADDVKKMKQDTGFVTVYFDWENDVIFFSGSGLDSTLQYCYYSNF